MTVTIDLKPDLDRRLRQLAQANGLAIEAYLVELIENTLPGQRHEAAVELLSRWSEEDATQDPDEIEARRGEWESLKTRLNQEHSSERVLFP